MATSNSHVLPHLTGKDRHKVGSQRCNSTDSSRSASIAGHVISPATATLPSTTTAAAAVHGLEHAQASECSSSSTLNSHKLSRKQQGCGSPEATRRLSNTVGPRIGLLHGQNPATCLGQLLQHCAEALCRSSLQSGFTWLRGCSTMLIPLCHNPAERLGQPLQHSSKPCEGPHCNQILLCFMVGHIEQADKGVHDPAVVTTHKLW